MHGVAEQLQIGIGGNGEFGKVGGDHMVGQGAHVVGALAVMKILEGTEADVGAGHPDQHGAGFDLLAHHRLVAADDGERARAGNAQAVERFAGEVFADGRAQYRAAVGKARVGRLAGALEMEVEQAGAGPHLAEQQAAAVAQLRAVTAELVAGVDHGERRAARRVAVAAGPGEEFRGVEGGGRQSQQPGHRGVGGYQMWIGKAGGCECRIEGIAQGVKAVIEMKPVHGRIVSVGRRLPGTSRYQGAGGIGSN